MLSRRQTYSLTGYTHPEYCIVLYNIYIEINPSIIVLKKKCFQGNVAFPEHMTSICLAYD